jgi:hypothetical protein
MGMKAQPAIQEMKLELLTEITAALKMREELISQANVLVEQINEVTRQLRGIGIRSARPVSLVERKIRKDAGGKHVNRRGGVEDEPMETPVDEFAPVEDAGTVLGG